MTKQTLNYYNFGPILSYNAPWTVVTGARGTGKTYGAKKIALRRFLDKGSQFVYLRRHKGEKAAFQTFMADIADRFPDHDFTVRQNSLWVDDGTKTGALVGRCTALTQARQAKSMSFREVGTLIFDEFILEEGLTRYLPKEADIFEGFYSTIDRWDDRVQVLFLANAASITNPYFIKYGIVPSSEFETYHDGFIAVHTSDDAVFANQVAQTKFGRFLSSVGGDNADYMMKSRFVDNNGVLIGRKPHYSDYACTVVTELGEFSLWIDPRQSGWYCQEKLPKQQLRITSEVKLVTESTMYCSPRDSFLASARRMYNRGELYFDKPQTRNCFIQTFRGV